MTAEKVATKSGLLKPKKMIIKKGQKIKGPNQSIANSILQSCKQTNSILQLHTKGAKQGPKAFTTSEDLGEKPNIMVRAKAKAKPLAKQRSRSQTANLEQGPGQPELTDDQVWVLLFLTQGHQNRFDSYMKTSESICFVHGCIKDRSEYLLKAPLGSTVETGRMKITHSQMFPPRQVQDFMLDYIDLTQAEDFEIASLEDVWEFMDEDGSGKISLEEFCAMIAHFNYKVGFCSFQLQGKMKWITDQRKYVTKSYQRPISILPKAV